MYIYIYIYIILKLSVKKAAQNLVSGCIYIYILPVHHGYVATGYCLHRGEVEATRLPNVLKKVAKKVYSSHINFASTISNYQSIQNLCSQ